MRVLVSRYSSKPSTCVVLNPSLLPALYPYCTPLTLFSPSSRPWPPFFTPTGQAGESKDWCYDNFLNYRSLQATDSVREQLVRPLL